MLLSSRESLVDTDEWLSDSDGRIRHCLIDIVCRTPIGRKRKNDCVKIGFAKLPRLKTLIDFGNPLGHSRRGSLPSSTASSFN